ncbi:protein FAR-RED IMPAIRED RESPONSE 1-like [Arachis stenosperma]|uniref:protein FAR-RED IMPAIRED RESPONSE 1-like n=1 Tax=Arachis stenosperma TaxID=217475 RepID=UPI0025AC8BDC|nr:protein FAR-RED IMPAIRED RESPONSE 1-like [Arachis stenosperma]
MHQKEPKVVVTDGDESMKEAIKTEFSNATHRLCTWHLARNAVSNIKDNDFCAAFKTAVYGHFEVEEFDQYWADMVAAFGLEENEWIWATYEKRVHWANAYLCDKFCAGLRTTSRCEGINASLKRFIKSSNFLLELVENLEQPVITTALESIERAMSQIYTREIFFEVKKQIEGVAALIVLHRESSGSTEKFMFRKFQLEKDALLMRLVLKRWCKDAKSGSFDDSDGGLDSNRAFRGRYGSLWTSCLPMCLLAAQRPATYEHAAAKIAQLLKEIEAEVSKGNSSTSVHDTVDGEDILDPKIIKSKGAPRSTGNGKTARRCRRCHGFGHDRRNCTANKEDMLDEVSAKFEVVNGSVTI